MERAYQPARSPQHNLSNPNQTHQKKRTTKTKRLMTMTKNQKMRARKRTRLPQNPQ
jgi:2-polyprenyl-3-methyl-5-hydroxy-6-metoxy-1,4-benzoquinol methylase